MNPLLEALNYVGGSLDKPGRAVRGLLGGRPEEALAALPFSDALGITDPRNAVSGRRLLENVGALDPKAEGDGFGLGDVAGMGVEAALDPLNLVGGLALKGLSGAKRAATESNALREALLAKGAMPEEVAALTKAVDEAGQPLRTYHGTPHVFDQYDLAKADTGSAYGGGIYTTADPAIASEYADKGAVDEVRKALTVPEGELARAMREGWMARDPQLQSRYADRSDQFLHGIAQSHLSSDFHYDPALGDAVRHLFEEQHVVSPKNVRSHYVDARNPFEVGKPITLADAGGLVSGPEAIAKAVEWRLPLAERARLADPAAQISGQQAYTALRDIAGRSLGQTNANEILRRAGYDAIHYPGGEILGGPKHDVWVAFDPSQMYAPWLAPAERQAPRLSPLLAAMFGENVAARGSAAEGA